MTIEQIANRFHQLSQEGKWFQIQDELFDKNAKSIEPAGSKVLPSVEGIEAIRKKGKDWENNIKEVHGGYTSAPVVAGNYFTVAMGFDATFKDSGRQKSDEIAVYEVKDGKIVKEQFFF